MHYIKVFVLIFASFQSLDCLHTVSDRLNYFDVDLLWNVAKGKSGNVMVSPASIKSTLGMLLEGAMGPTALEIQTALRLSPNKEDSMQQLRVFMNALQVNTSSVTVQNANAMFASRKLQFKKDYEARTKRFFGSELNKVDFGDPRRAADIINDWVSSKTDGHIPFIVDEAHITPNTEFLVTNALYFKGTWRHAFEPLQTLDNCFYKNGICKNVAMMELAAELRYTFVENLRAHAVELPYQDDRYSMILLVPQDRHSELAIIRDLPYVGLLHIPELLCLTDVSITMPKFTVEYAEDMVATLKNMGINTLFSNAANVSGIFEASPDTGYLNSIYHKVYMQVDEKGTVAAAASAGMVVPLINNFVNVVVDRPFLFFIWDNEKKILLFEGKIEEPTEVVKVPDVVNGQKTIKVQPPNSSDKIHFPSRISENEPSHQVQTQGQGQPIQLISQPGSQPIGPGTVSNKPFPPLDVRQLQIQGHGQPDSLPTVTTNKPTPPPPPTTTTKVPWYKIIFG